MRAARAPEVVDRYAIHDVIAAGGMATVHLGRLAGVAGFSRTVAIKRMHQHVAQDPDFVSMFLDEARLVARIRHPNVVPTLDVISSDGELFLVMEFVHGESLANLLRGDSVSQPAPRMRPRIAASIATGVLRGLHAAHEAKNERGEPLHIVHRDVSPQNIMVGVDGVPRVLDFGVAKAANRLQTTQKGQLKGKLAYMSPEQVRQADVDRRGDIFSVGAVLWEMLVGRRLYDGGNEMMVMNQLVHEKPIEPSQADPELAPYDAIVMTALQQDPDARFQTARQMAEAIEGAVPLASPSEVGDWVELTAGEALASRATRVAAIESGEMAPAAEARAEMLSSGDISDSTVRAATVSSPGLDAEGKNMPTSGVTNVSMSGVRPNEPLPASQVRLLAGVGIGAAAVVALLTAGVISIAGSDAPEDAAQPVSATTETPAPAADPPVAEAPDAMATAQPAPEPSTTAETAASAQPSAEPPAPSPVAPPRGQPRPAPPKPAAKKKRPTDYGF